MGCVDVWILDTEREVYECMTTKVIQFWYMWSLGEKARRRKEF